MKRIKAWTLATALLLTACSPVPPTPQPRAQASLAFLLKQPRAYHSEQLLAAAGRAFGKKPTLTEDTPDSTRLDLGDGWRLVVQHFSSPYPQVVGVPRHQAWTSVDVVAQPSDAPRLEAYQHVGRLLAEMGGDDVLYILQPESGKLQPYQSQDVPLLRLNPLVDLHFEGEPPVTEVSGSDPALQAAEAEARRRFPEFRARFDRHPKGERFYVKSAFGDAGQHEFMWSLVESFQGKIIQASLANDPEQIGGMKLGDPVEIPLDHVEDWNVLNQRGDMVAGGFTVKVLMQREAQGSAEKRTP